MLRKLNKNPLNLTIAELVEIANAARSFSMAANKHVGGGLSLSELLAVLYFGDVANLEKQHHVTGSADHVVFSKGHAPSSYYLCLWLHGMFGDISLDDLVNYGDVGHVIPRIPKRNLATGIEMSSGVLGQGLSFGCGLAVSDKFHNRPEHTYVVLGDAECGEGQIWESAEAATLLGLQNITVLLDGNGFGSTIRIDSKKLEDKWAAFGWDVVSVDGHNIEALQDALKNMSPGRTVLMANTVKGSGLRDGWAGTNRVHGTNLSSDAFPKDIQLENNVSKAKKLLAPLLAKTVEVAMPGQKQSDQPSGLSKFKEREVGSLGRAKLVADDFMEDADRWCDVFVATPEAVSNSGISKALARMGSWEWGNPKSRVIEGMIAEQNMASMAAGITAGGFRAIVPVPEGFVWRMLDSIRQSIAYQSLPTVILGTSGGLGDPLGPMVNSDGCISALAAIPNLLVMEACDINQALYLINYAWEHELPAYIRLPHERINVISSFDELSKQPDDRGFWVLEDHNKPDAIIMASGATVPEALKARELLAKKHKIKARVVQMYSVTLMRKLETEKLREFFPDSVPSVSIYNGPSSLMSVFLGRNSLSFGVNDFGRYGKPLTDHYREYKIDAESVVETILRLAESA